MLLESYVKLEYIYGYKHNDQYFKCTDIGSVLLEKVLHLDASFDLIVEFVHLFIIVHFWLTSFFYNKNYECTVII